MFRSSAPVRSQKLKKFTDKFVMQHILHICHSNVGIVWKIRLQSLSPFRPDASFSGRNYRSHILGEFFMMDTHRIPADFIVIRRWV